MAIHHHSQPEMMILVAIHCHKCQVLTLTSLQSLLKITQIVCNGKPVYSVPVVNMVMGRGSSTLPSLFNLWSAAFSAANTEVLEYLPETNETKAAMEVLAAPLLVSSTRTPGFAIVRASILRAQEMEQLVMPFAGVATVAVYSLCGALDTACELAGRELKLSVALLADLVEGNINTWGDARLKALNPWLTSASSSVINSPVQLIGEPPTSDTMMMLRAVLMRSTPSLTFATFQPGGSAGDVFTPVEVSDVVAVDTPAQPSCATLPTPRIEITLENGRRLSVSDVVDAGFVVELARGLAA